eukprot:9501067-Pyramimonas_sp.AAC.1
MSIFATSLIVASVLKPAPTLSNSASVSASMVPARPRLPGGPPGLPSSRSASAAARFPYREASAQSSAPD